MEGGCRRLVGAVEGLRRGLHGGVGQGGWPGVLGPGNRRH